MSLRRTGLMVIAAVAMAGVASCLAASSPGHSARGTAGAAGTVPPTVVEPSDSTFTPEPPDSDFTPVPPPPPPKPAYPACTAGQLSGWFTGNVGAGSAFADVMLTNTSDRPCTLSGWPKEILGVGASGALAVVSRGPFLAGGTPGAANLRPGNTGELVLNYAFRSHCPVVSQIVVVLADGGRVTVASSRRYPWWIPTACGVGISSFEPTS